MDQHTISHSGAWRAGGHVVRTRCSEFPREHISEPHRHDEAQLVLAADGAMIMDTAEGPLVVPPHGVAWIPCGVVHNARMIGSVSTMTVWIQRLPKYELPTKCRAVNGTPVMRRLLQEIMKIGLRAYPGSLASSDVGLLLNEFETLPALPDRLPLPKDPRLAAQCISFLRGPSAHQTISEWSATLRMSRRTFTRRFRQETGVSFVAWRQQACLFAALPRLAAGESITTIAIDLGYESPAAFTTMFKRHQGMPPSRRF